MRDSTKPKICFLAGTLGRGGAERQLVYMLRALRLAGVSARVICLTQGEAFEGEIRALGLSVEWVGHSALRPFRLASIVQSLSREPADIIQSAHFYTNLYAAVAGRLMRVRDIGAIRCDVTSEIADNGFAGKWNLQAPSHLIANTALARDRAIAKGIRPDRIDFVPNVVDSDWLYERRKHNGHRVAKILFAGRMCEQKRPDRFLRVMSKITRALPAGRVKAVMAGDGPMRSSLLNLASDLGLPRDQLEILGEQRDVRSLYRDADLLMLTSDWEGAPNVLLEGMASGIPVVATRVGGVSEMVGADRGFVVEAEDEEGLVTSALRLIENSDLRQALGNSGRNYVKRFHSLTSLQKNLTDIYQRVLSR